MATRADLKLFGTAINAEIDAQIRNAQVRLGKGQCKDYPEYKKVVGEVHGLEKAQDIVSDMVQRMEMDEDD